MSLQTPQCGTRVDNTRNAHFAKESWLSEKGQAKTKCFQADKDIMFIPNYVFEYCENKNVTLLSYIPEGGLPESLLRVEGVGIHASALSGEYHDGGKISNSQGKETPPHEVGDIVWGKQLRFIMKNFPSIQVILVTTTTVLDMYRPKTCPLAYELFHQIEAIDPDDRGRLGIMNGQRHSQFCPTCPTTGRATDFVLTAWDEIKTEWPLYNNTRVKYKLSPRLGIAGMVFFAKEWVNVEREGEHGTSCRIMDNELPSGPIKTAVRMERAACRAQRVLKEVPRWPSKTVSSRGDRAQCAPQRDDFLCPPKIRFSDTQGKTTKFQLPLLRIIPSVRFLKTDHHTKHPTSPEAPSIARMQRSQSTRSIFKKSSNSRTMPSAISMEMQKSIRYEEKKEQLPVKVKRAASTRMLKAKHSILSFKSRASVPALSNGVISTAQEVL